MRVGYRFPQRKAVEVRAKTKEEESNKEVIVGASAKICARSDR